MIAYVFYGIGALCLCYFVIIAFLTQMNSLFHLIWTFIAAFFVGMGFLYSRQQAGTVHLPESFFIVVEIGIAAGFLWWIGMTLMIYSHAARGAGPGAKYLIILGAQVKGDKPSLALLCRLQAALSYAEKNPETVLIASGAQGTGERITEAECMRRYLLDHGIGAERILLEEGSYNTDENIACSAKLIGDKAAFTVIATSTFHTFRAVAIAKKQGYIHVEGIGAENNLIMLPSYYLRESMAVVKYKLSHRI